MVEALQSPAQATYWLISGQVLFLILNLLGLACFSYIVAKRLTPLLRGERDFRFDRPLVRLERASAILAGAVEASALPDRRDHSHPYLCGLHYPGDSCLLPADSRRLREFRDAGFLGRNRPYLRASSRTTRRPLSSSAWSSPQFAGWSSSPRATRCRPRYGKDHTADAIFLLALIAAPDGCPRASSRPARLPFRRSRASRRNSWRSCHCRGC